MQPIQGFEHAQDQQQDDPAAQDQFRHESPKIDVDQSRFKSVDVEHSIPEFPRTNFQIPRTKFLLMKFGIWFLEFGISLSRVPILPAYRPSPSRLAPSKKEARSASLP